MNNFKNLTIIFILLLVSCNGNKDNFDKLDSINEYNPDDFKKIELFIKNDRLIKIDSIRIASLELNNFTNAKKWFKAKVIYNYEKVKAKVRLKGDLQDHYDTDRFSLRLKFKHNNQNSIHSLQHPKTRKYICEWIFHQILKQENLNYLNYEFVTVKINNVVRGLYAHEEHFTNHGIEKKWNRPHGPILGFDDSGFWAGGLDTVIRDLKYDTKAYINAKIRVFNYNEHDSIAQVAINLLNAYRNENLQADSVFDMEIMGKFYAICDLNGATHGLRWLNCRYYYNPNTKRLEPIGFDSNSGKLKKLIYFDDYLNGKHHLNIKKSKNFVKSYKSSLTSYRNKSYLDKFFKVHEASINLYISAIMDTDSIDCSNDLNNYYNNQKLMIMP